MAAEIRGVSTELGDDMNLSVVATMAASARDKRLLQKPQELPPSRRLLETQSRPRRSMCLAPGTQRLPHAQANSA